ncbi:MAG: hypothetical protein OEW11_01465 [Nitrospirota bacterium]|nr:hypothetical protein [Nitrospirota bacterium]
MGRTYPGAWPLDNQWRPYTMRGREIFDPNGGNGGGDPSTGCTITTPAAGGTGSIHWQMTGTLQSGAQGAVSYDAVLE